MMVADTPAPALLIAAASALSELLAGVMVKGDPPTERVKLVAVLGEQIKISYTELLRSDAGSATYIYPLSTEKFSARPIKDLSVKVELKTIDPLASIYSPSHKVEIKRDGANRAVIGYESKNEKPDTDFQIVYSSEKRDVGLNLMTSKPDAEDGYFLLLAAPTVVTVRLTV